MKDFDLKNYIIHNPLTGRKELMKEAFEGMKGVGGVSVVGDAPKKSPHGWSGDEGQPEGINTWIADIDRYPAIDGWKASWEYPGVIAWTHEEIGDAQVLATPGWDGKGTPVEFQSDAGSTQMLKVLDQEEFSSFKEYAAAIKPYLDMVADANLDPTGDGRSPRAQRMPSDIAEDASMTSDAGWEYDDQDIPNESPMDRIYSLVNQRQLQLFRKSALDIAQDLDDEGFDREDIVSFLVNFIEDNLS